VALSWEPAREADLAGYRVWRREAGQAQWTMVMELPPAESSFTDTTVEKNKRYVYAITAFDRAGNESEKSEEAAGLSRRSGG
jgi:fibronectin type 3 domain-containing protein